MTYHSPGQLWKLAKALEWGCKDDLDPMLKHEQPAMVDDVEDIEPEDQEELKQIAISGESFDRDRITAYQKQAQLLVKGNQNHVSRPAYLIDCLRLALNKEPVYATIPNPDDLVRIQRISSALTAETFRLEGSVSEKEFRQALDDHASGFLAPLIREMSVACVSDTLPEGVVLVDLPGIGVASDIHCKITSRWIREKAKAVALVVNHRGVQEAEAQLLHQSGFLNRLLYSVDNPSEDPLLIVAVVRLDEIAGSRWRDQRASGVACRKRDFFPGTCEESRSLVLAQVRGQIERAWASAPMQSGQKQVVENLVNSLEIHPVSALEYSRFLVDDPEDRSSFLANASDSNLPALLESLGRLAERHRETEAHRIEEPLRNLSDRLIKTLKVIEAQWQEDARASQLAARLRNEFLEFLTPLRTEYDVRKGSFREFFRETLPQVISSNVVQASASAREEISAYLEELKIFHWKTLQAAVRKGGVFHSSTGRKIDLPHDFALRFEAPVAQVWGGQILKEIRRRTKSYAEDCVQLVDEVVAWAKNQGARVQPRLVEAQRDAIKADVKTLESVGKEMVKELRQMVSERLVEKIEKPIRTRCKKFVEQNQHQGTGVRNRMLGLFQELADQVTKVARGPAEEILVNCFREVEGQILDVFRQGPDPLDAARDAIIEAHERYIRNSDAQRRQKVLNEVDSLLSSYPLRDRLLAIGPSNTDASPSQGNIAEVA